jgi:UDP-N-acetylmuramoyl-L-alanyl-D-glutamate--2,6-diaminopimelate ligase
VLQELLARMVDQGVTHCVLETTSHGLAQQRVTAIEFDVSVITNITHEHLDYHGSFANYAAVKLRLFHLLNQPLAHFSKQPRQDKTAVFNLDDPESFAPIAAIEGPRQVTYSCKSTAAALYTGAVVTDPQGTFVEFIEQERRDHLYPVHSRLLGEFNVYNMLAAAGTARALGLPWKTIQRGLEEVRGLYGRMHQIDKGQPFIVHVDFAHTPDGLKKAINAARKILDQTRGAGRVIAIFGSAGKRDPQKRRMMAEISTSRADLTVLTAEDPRTESLPEILEAMAAGCRHRGGIEGENFWRVPDRGQAIYFACTLAADNDFVLICGKGHEQSMCFGTIEHQWDDVHAAEAALESFLKGEPMPDLGLPTYDPQFYEQLLNLGNKQP